ncbi:hypothetical protein Bbelb_216240 [Branchiostoma belcheri]|nr:hypothetical protein Bbelb_216240 [Branchiostoma belcheri]
MASLRKKTKHFATAVTADSGTPTAGTPSREDSRQRSPAVMKFSDDSSKLVGRQLSGSPRQLKVRIENSRQREVRVQFVTEHLKCSPRHPEAPVKLYPPVDRITTFCQSNGSGEVSRARRVSNISRYLNRLLRAPLARRLILDKTRDLGVKCHVVPSPPAATVFTRRLARKHVRAPMYYRKANAALLVYDITCRESFENIQSWVDELKKNVEGTIIMCVIGNKTDLASRREVSREKAEQYADSINALYYETSALTNDGIQEAFLQVSLSLIKLSQTDKSSGLTVYDGSASLLNADGIIEDGMHDMNNHRRRMDSEDSNTPACCS